MAKLEESITRDVAFHDSKEGKHYLQILEHGKEIYQSDLYEDQGECCQAGMDMMEFLHDKRPMRTDSIPAESFRVKV